MTSTFNDFATKNDLQDKDVSPYSIDPNCPPTWVLEDKIRETLWGHLIPIFPLLERDDVTELVINEPHYVYVEAKGKWEQYYIEEFTLSRLEEIAKQISNDSQQNFSQELPTLSATLPTGERVQICAFSSVMAGKISYTIRKPSNITITLEEYIESGYFDDVEWVDNIDINELLNSRYVSKEQKELALALHEKRWYDFFSLAIKHKQNILLSGSTGSGKTTFMKAMLLKIPLHERLLSIENVDELKVYDTHKNSVPLFYSAGGQGVSTLTQGDLLVCSLRMRPDRIFCAELLKGDEAFYYLRNIGSGHPGSITTMHANTAFGAKEQLVMFIKESEAGRSLTKQDILSFLDKTVDMIFQVSKLHGKRKMTQISFDPLKSSRKVEDPLTNEIAKFVEEQKALNEKIERLVNVTQQISSTTTSFFNVVKLLINNLTQTCIKEIKDIATSLKKKQ